MTSTPARDHTTGAEPGGATPVGVGSGSATPGEAREFDVCVIGAGAAGLVLAEMLSKDAACRVCLLESGPEHFRDRREPFHVRSLLKEHLGVNEGRVTAFGGATNTWGGGLIRLSAADFAPIEGRPDTAWPFSYESFVRHYEAVEELFGFSAAKEGPEHVVIERDRLLVRRREIPVLPFRSKNFAKRFGPGLKAKSNVTILCGATITTIHPAASGGVSHLDVQIAGGPVQRIAAKRFVIAAGIVNSNLLAERFMQACGVTGGGGKSGAETGRFFHDHLSFAVARLHPKSQGKFSLRFGYKFERGLMIGEHFDVETTNPRLPGAFVHLSFDTAGSLILRPVRAVLNAIQQRTLKLEGGLSMREVGALLIGLPRLGLMRYLRGRLYLDPGTKVLATLDLEQVPREEWRLERDGEGCSVRWDVAAEDVENAKKYIPICLEILKKLNEEAAFDVEMLIPDPEREPERFLEHLRRESEDTFHSAGGLRMGTGAGALVDAELRLAGAPNVHVLSTAVFPRVGTSNPTHTILALGHRLVGFIRTMR